MQKPQGDTCPHKKAEPPYEKLVDWNEMRRREDDLIWQQTSFGEKMFTAFVAVPYNMFLYVRRGIGETIDFLKSGGPKETAAAAYEDRLSDNIYINRAMVESDINYNKKHGLSKTFQEKAAKIKQQAFDESRDFGVLLQTGQLRRIDL